MIIAVDFDGTLVENNYPEIGSPLKGYTGKYTLIDEMKAMQARGHKIILWTCRCAEKLEEAVNFCKKHGLIFDAVNDDISTFGWEHEMDWWRKSGKARKVIADIYIDDRAMNISTTIPIETSYIEELCGAINEHTID